MQNAECRMQNEDKCGLRFECSFFVPHSAFIIPHWVHTAVGAVAWGNRGAASRRFTPDL
jgi:hypothetical protein